MWVRGLIELYLLFVTKNWKPIYGIIHNIFTALIFLLNINFNQIYHFEIILIITILTSLCLETYYAYFFKIKIGRLTQGNQAIWFASKETPIFKQVLLITTIGNAITYLGFFYFIFKLVISQN